MTCRDMDDVISSRTGDSELEPQPAEHLIHCERCRGLTRLLDQADDGLRPSESLLRRIQSGILKDLKPIRPLAPPRTLLYGCAIIFLSVVAVGALLLGMNGWGALSLVQRIFVFVTLAASAVLLAVSMVRQIVPGSKQADPAVLSCDSVVLMMVTAAAFRSRREWLLLRRPDCMKNGLTFSIPAARAAGLSSGAVPFCIPDSMAPSRVDCWPGWSERTGSRCLNLNVFHILIWLRACANRLLGCPARLYRGIHPSVALRRYFRASPCSQ